MCEGTRKAWRLPTIRLGANLVRLQLRPRPVDELICQHGDEEDLCDGSREGLVEVGLVTRQQGQSRGELLAAPALSWGPAGWLAGMLTVGLGVLGGLVANALLPGPGGLAARLATRAAGRSSEYLGIMAMCVRVCACVRAGGVVAQARVDGRAKWGAKPQQQGRRHSERPGGATTPRFPPATCVHCGRDPHP